MSLGRRKVALHERERWVGNRVAEAYAARPPYPSALLDALERLTGGAPARIADLGAGTGNLALPLAERGHHVLAIDPAEAMLSVLKTRADAAGLGASIECHHATAEALPLPAASVDLLIIADALHFLDAERAGHECARVLTPEGALAVVRCQLQPTAFMTAVSQTIDRAAPRRPRDTTGALAQLAALARVPLTAAEQFECHTQLEPGALEQLLCSISFLGPAMNEARFAAFRTEVMEIPPPRVWSRNIELRAGRRGGRGTRTFLT